MRTSCLILVSLALFPKVWPAEDIYWEGENDASNEFLEVEDADAGLFGSLRRFKRFVTTASPDTYDTQTDDDVDTDDLYGKEDDGDNDFDGGSGSPDRLEPETKEKTLHVTFVVIQPYQTTYSNRDSVEFQNFSKSLAEAVNTVFRDVPGTHRASLVRIQSRPTDEFSCKVTLDIVTNSGDTDRIAEILRDYIRNNRKLGDVAVNDDDFSAAVLEPGYNTPLNSCGPSEIRCSEGRCISQSMRCDGHDDCSDGSDELNCPIEDRGDVVEQNLDEDTPDLDESFTTPDSFCSKISCQESSVKICLSQLCDSKKDCPLGDDEENCDKYEPERPEDRGDVVKQNPDEDTPDLDESFTTPVACSENERQCDETRCVPVDSFCNNVRDCEDGSDEADCFTQYCGSDDFRCPSDGKCVEASRVCDSVIDCADGSDERNCPCREGEFKCQDESACIEDRKRCDGISHCRDQSDEANCTCSSNQWQCDHGSCIKRSRRCDGRVDCPTDRSDERNCVAVGYFRCRSGKLIPDYQRCNRRYDCDSGDYSDEKNCPCGDGDFKCDNGYCIPPSKHCDRTHDCQDGSDERDCTYGTICMAYQYKCTSGACVPAEARCNGTAECLDVSDERDCPCKRDELKCGDGSCISIARRCDGRQDCLPLGEDEFNCASVRVCPEDRFTCNPTSVASRWTRSCAIACDGVPECDGAEDEMDCDDTELPTDCEHECDGKCLNETQICNNIRDCVDGSDELNCGCDKLKDFRCQSGECINAVLRCNGLQECDDGSDEDDCENTVTPTDIGACGSDQFQCGDGTCINGHFRCDSHRDCNDNSDEENCPRTASQSAACAPAQFTCYDGRCIPHSRRCDNIYDCADFSDEQNCYKSANMECEVGYWMCHSGQCIREEEFCDGVSSCADNSDELDCSPEVETTHMPFDRYPEPTLPPPLPTTYIPDVLRLNITYPSDQTIRYRTNEVPSASVESTQSTKRKKEKEKVGDVVFSCRDESEIRAAVRWVREGGRPLKPGATDINGRLEMTSLTPADSGVYICQAPRYLGRPGSEARATLVVEAPTSILNSPSSSCPPEQEACGNGQCIPRSAICDGKADCANSFDENSCVKNGTCEPNQFECSNRRCIYKMFTCDGQDDCGDNTDEQDCRHTDDNQQCLPVEFACRKHGQCIPKYFHCDGRSDCKDGSDELGCTAIAVITRPPYPANVQLNEGDSLTLECEAVAVPTPLISWRLNWRLVPKKCQVTSRNGVGRLYCPDMQFEDSGAYSCEVLGSNGSSFANPDSIVSVKRGERLCPGGYFNSEAKSRNECVRCFCFGKSSDCRSADLYIMNMPTPLGEGGTRLVGVRQTYTGDVQLDKQQSITNHYYYQPLRNGATVTKLADVNAGWSTDSGDHPYLTLPENYYGDQLKSYGGSIRYRLSPHAPQTYASPDGLADIIVMGKYRNLLYTNRRDQSRDSFVEARFTPGNWQKSSPRGLVPASREDIMMALDDIKMILLRADLNNAGVNITEFVMESGQFLDAGLGATSLVEECTCPEGYKGLSCQKCASGYERVMTGPWLGTCVAKKECPPGTYGDPRSGGDCRPCPCPLTNRENQFARTCAIGQDGDVVCDCMPGYEGKDCSYCAQGYYGNPLIVGNSCKPKPSKTCNAVGTTVVRPPDECVCKENVEGRNCDQCKFGFFFLSNDFRHGCAQCFCTGVTQNCTMSNLRRETTAVRFNVPDIVGQVRLYKSAPVDAREAVRYTELVETALRPTLTRNGLGVTTLERAAGPAVYYWSLPSTIFSGDKVTSYGGYLNYELNHVTSPGIGSRNNAADVQLISMNSLTFHYFGNFVPASDGYLNASVQFLESDWQRADGHPVTREHLLMALADVKTILVKASYSEGGELASIASASIDTASPGGPGAQALHVEQCSCPRGYRGTSCEDCAPGYTRSGYGIYLEQCAPCDCNGHSTMCHPDTGVCANCAHNTAGPKCEECREGYYRDQYDNCVSADITQSPTCNCDPRGEAEPCYSGYCSCKQNVEGQYCDRCRPGTFGLDAKNPLGCIDCYCSGATKDCHAASHYNRIRMPAPIFGENYGGYALMDINANQVNNQFVPDPIESELSYTFSTPPSEELYWSLPAFPGNRVLSYGGTISLTQKFYSSFDDQSSPGIDVILVGDELSVYWSNPTIIRSGEALSYQVPLEENEWYILNSATRASRHNFMSVLKNLRRVLVRGTLSRNIVTTSIAAVSMDTAMESYDVNLPAATGVEVCLCPEGFTGTSCESCVSGYYKDASGYCRQCNCNGHECQLDRYGEVVCNCRLPYNGPDCSTLGLIMELQPEIQHRFPNSSIVDVTFWCNYKAAEPLSIKFYHNGQEVGVVKSYDESRRYSTGWQDELAWRTSWDPRRPRDVYECRTLTRRGFTLGVLTTTLPREGEEVTTTYRPYLPKSTVVVRISGPTIKIQEVGSTVNFTCQAKSKMTRNRLRVKWYKADGDLPLERTQFDEKTGEIIITNLQVSDSGQYICESNDGVSTEQATATLKVPGIEMSQPTVSISPPVREYYEGDRVELVCSSSGNPAPKISWQRAAHRALPYSALVNDALLVLENALVEDSGEYRCIASNAAGSAFGTAMITVRPRPSAPARERLTVSATAPAVGEGQDIKIVCTASPNVAGGTIEWVRQDGAPFSSNVHSDNGVLYVDRAFMQNQGVYVCQATSYDISPVLVVLTVIPISTPSPNDAPNITLSEDRIEIPTGGSKTIDCYPNGNPLPLIKWSKSQDTFGPGTSQRENTLIITNAQETDRGYYVCEGLVDGAPVVRNYVYVEVLRRERPEVEIYPQGENSVPLGSQYNLQCLVMGGIPPPVVTWSRSGGRPLSPHVQIQQNNRLRFQNMEVNDEGEYTCTATNEAGSASATATLKVHSLPEITITPDSYVRALVGDRVEVECRANGYPEPFVSIAGQDRRVLVPPAARMAVLIIPRATDDDDGDYVCTAVSPAGTIEEQFAIRLERGDVGLGDTDEGSGERDPSSYPDIDNEVLGPNSNNPNTNNPNNVVIAEGKTTKITCEASGEYRVQWRRADRQPLQDNARQVGTDLIIQSATKRDSGTYECILINQRTQVAQLSAITSFSVVAEPRITLQPPTQTVHPGDSTMVKCVVDGDDIVSVYWRPVNRALSRRVEVRNNTLIFRQIEVEDAGQYECVALGQAGGEAHSFAEVIVSEETDRETSESHDNEQYAHVGAGVHLSCNVTQRGLNIQWTKDGHALPRSVSHKSDGSIFIRNAHKSDSGYYVCVISDRLGRQTSNYINLHIEGFYCSERHFHCLDGSNCIEEELVCDGQADCADYSDESDHCGNRIKRRPTGTQSDPKAASASGANSNPSSLISINQSQKTFKVGEKVEVLCRAVSRDIRVKWERYGTNQYVETRIYGDGALLIIPNVQEYDAGVYRCIGEDVRQSRTSYEDFNLVVVPSPNEPVYPSEADKDTTVTARLGDMVQLPCIHNLDGPTAVEWKREYSPLAPHVRTNEEVLQLERVTEADAGVYVCRVTNDRAHVEARATLRVLGVIPRFNGDGWIAIPTLRDAYSKFDIEISFKPADDNGILLYNSENEDGTGDYLLLQLVDGVPQFTLSYTAQPITTVGDRPLQLNAWHTIRISRSESKVTMDVDNTGPFVAESPQQYGVLDLHAPLFVGHAPSRYPQSSGFIGCVSMLILGKEEKNIIGESIQSENVQDCDSCAPNLCLNNGVCQEARNERGYMCLCAAGFAGLNCDRAGEACRPGLCGPGRCSDTADGYKCACPVTFTGKNCDIKQSIAYPAFAGSAYLAIKAPTTSRYLKMSMKIKARAPVADGIIMYCAQSPRGYGGFTSLAVHDSRVEFRYHLGDGYEPIILTSNKTLPANEWTDIRIARFGPVVSLKIDMFESYEARLASPKEDLNLQTAMYIGGVEDSIVLNNNTGVTGGFLGCIKDVSLHEGHLDLTNASILSANIQECANFERGDIPETDSVCSQCRNNGYCVNAEASACTCPPGFTGLYCETRVPLSNVARPARDPCLAAPCMHGGTCRPDRISASNYTCDCPLGYTGANCHRQLELLQSVGFNGDGYLELPESYLRYDQIQSEPALVALAFHTSSDGVLLYQTEAHTTDVGDFLMLRVERGVVVMEWDSGSGPNTLAIDEIPVVDGERHRVAAKMFNGNHVELMVDGRTRTAITNGISSVMNADSNIYIGGIPDKRNTYRYPGLNGCIEQVEFNSDRSINLGGAAVTGRNAQRCKDLMFPDVYPFFEEIEVFESPPPDFHFNSIDRPALSALCIAFIPSFFSFINSYVYY